MSENKKKNAQCRRILNNLCRYCPLNMVELVEHHILPSHQSLVTSFQRIQDEKGAKEKLSWKPWWTNII